MAITGGSVQEILRKMQERLSHVVPEIEMLHKAELVYEIQQLKKEKDAVILGHNYMEPALYHTVTDFNGDSLELSRKATKVENERIVFCGVEFMAETAKILNPEKKVLIPKRAGCSLAKSITAQDVRDLRAKYPGVPVVTYINTYADVKAETDVCCTSGNAAQVVKMLGSERIIFLPDEYLAKNVALETGKEVIFPESDPTKLNQADGLTRALIGWHGKCEVHDQFTTEDIANVRAQYPDVHVLAHPECPPEVVAASDFSGSTSKMIDYVKNMPAPHYLLLTECAMGDNIIAENPEKDVLRLCSVRCPHMNQITLEHTRDSLLFDRYEITVDEAVRVRARRSLERMLELS